MKYPDDYINQVICGDCLEVMRGMPDKCVDLVVTDPPYGIGAYKDGTMGGGVLAKQSTFKATDWDYTIPKREIFDEIFRVSKEQIIFGGNYFIDYLKNTSSFIVWDKDNGDNNFADCELAWTSHKTAVRRLKYRWQGMLQGNMSEKERKFHPTQKPQPVMRWILEKYAKKTNLILDPFMGSGTTLCACQELGMEYIGVEINQEYCDIAKKRLFNTQGSLF